MFDGVLEERNNTYIFQGRSDPGIKPPFLLGVTQYCDTGEITIYQKYEGDLRSRQITLSPSDWKQTIELMTPYLEEN